MSLATKINKAEKLKIAVPEGATEEVVDGLIEAEEVKIKAEKEEDKIKKAEEKKAADAALKTKLILKDVDGDDVDQADYFYPRKADEKIDGKEFKKTSETAPAWFNRTCGYPVEREELLEVFNQQFSKKKGFLFYKQRDSEVYLVIVPLKYATTISGSNESQPGDYQRHAMSFISEGSVNIDSLKMKLKRIANHSSISKEPLA